MISNCLDAAKYTSYNGQGSLQPKKGLQVSIMPRLRNPDPEAWLDLGYSFYFLLPLLPSPPISQ